MYDIRRYGLGIFAPGINDPGFAPYKAAHTLIKAHAKAYRLYDRNYRSVQGGQVGISINSDWAEPKDPTNPDDIAAADRYLQVSDALVIRDHIMSESTVLPFNLLKLNIF